MRSKTKKKKSKKLCKSKNTVLVYLYSYSFSISRAPPSGYFIAFSFLAHAYLIDFTTPAVKIPFTV